MRITIVADDGAVGVDGEFISGLDLSSLDPTIHAVQWYGEYGEVEYKATFADGVISKPGNETITDVAPYQFVVDAWSIAKAEADAKEEAVAKAMAAARLTNKSQLSTT